MSRNVIVDTDERVKPTADVVATEQDKAPEAPEPTSLPEKYKGKSVEDVIEMHRNAEQLNGRLANELGSYKKNASAWIDQQLVQSKPKEVEEEIDDDLYLENPKEAINKAVNKRVKGIEQKVEEQERNSIETAFNQKYNVESYVSDPDFTSWLQKSDRRLQKAATVQAYNTNWKASVDAAAELFDSYNEFKAETKKVEPAKHKKPNVSDAHAESGKESGTAGKSYEFKRSELLAMRTEDPDKFDRIQTRIIKAIKDGKVLDDLRN